MKRISGTRGVESAIGPSANRFRRQRTAAALLMCAIVVGCPKGPTISASSPWTDYLPDNNAGDFLNRLGKLQFPPPPNPLLQKRPHDAAKRSVEVAIFPESNILMFDPSDGSSDAPTGATGRILAKAVINDTKLNLDEYQLKANSKPYVVWWVETDKTPFESHYYLVDEAARTVKQVRSDKKSFRFCSTGHHSAATADWDQHLIDKPDMPCALDSSSRVADGNSTWVSCGMGCCNGKR